MRLGLALLAFLTGIMPDAAAAHTAERGFVMLLPTGHYIVGGAAAVAATFIVLLFLPPRRLRQWFGAPAPAPSEDRTSFGRVAVSCVGFAIFAFLVYAGFAGTRDPLLNPLPLAVWTFLWVALPFVHAAFGDLWSWINPWTGPVAWVRRLAGSTRAPLALPDTIGYWPGVAVLFGFGWFELVDSAPDDPSRLAGVAAVYWVVTFAAMLLFGPERWRRHGECLSIFFGFIALLAPVRRNADGGVSFCLPGAKIFDAPPPGLSGTVFILLALATVSFDGLSKTFWYLDLIGINPLDFPGRSAVIVQNTVGLAAAAFVLIGAYVLALKIGSRTVADLRAFPVGGSLVLSLLPISLAYHFAHYLTMLLINSQYALLAVNDPLGNGANVFGLGDTHVTTSFMADFHSVQIIWNFQAGAIVLGHVWAVVLAHGWTARLADDVQSAARAQVPLAVLMVAYTVFGLWLMASPTGL